MENEQLVRLTRVVGGDDPVAGLAAVAELRRELGGIEALLVRRARNQGRTWGEIATLLGVTKQAVHKKYGGRRVFGSEC